MTRIKTEFMKSTTHLVNDTLILFSLDPIKNKIIEEKNTGLKKNEANLFLL